LEAVVFREIVRLARIAISAANKRNVQTDQAAEIVSTVQKQKNYGEILTFLQLRQFQ